MSNLADLQRACECIAKAFQQLSNGIEEVAEAFRKMFTTVEEERRKNGKRTKKGTSPRAYGASLVSNSAAKASVKSYDYIPSVRRNLPYQRRRF